MKTIRLKVADKDYKMALEFLKQVKMFKIIDGDDFDIPQEHKQILDERWSAIENGSAQLVDWNTIKKDLFKKYGKAKS
ncbi:MAG: addiction module protein [Sphingobacteriales bacterium JAD_PAG50586_3]|nr:MAG: addiction module protein [Sphingobacteriales bacterium JAD_PAG50586_3]